MTAELELPPYRPPSEADSVLVRVTRGCPWNKCTFCGMYKDLSFELRPAEEIIRDLPRLREVFPAAASVFLADADSLTHPDLPEILQAIRRTFPEAERITSYARFSTLRGRSQERLRLIRQAGLDRLHVGLESGSARILQAVRKGTRPDRAIAASRRAIEAGFELSLYVLSGLGGEDDWEEHAEQSAAVLSEVSPHFLRLRSLVILPGTPLHDACDSGAFIPASPLTRLRETRRLIEHLEPTSTHELRVCSDHFSNMIWADSRPAYNGIEGCLPRDRRAMLAACDRALRRLEASRRIEDPSTLARRGRLLSLY